MDGTRTRAQAGPALGYLFVFVPGLLLVAGREFGADWLVVAAIFVVFPLLRVVFADVPGSAPVWTEGWARVLHSLPRAYAIFLGALTAWVAWVLGHGQRPAGIEAVLFGISWWLVNSLATCVAHELLHRPECGDRALGRWLAALAGYPILGHEHLAHHAHPGDTARAEYARVGESLWRYVARRTPMAWIHAIEWDSAESARRANRWRPGGLKVAVAITLGTWAVFAAVGGGVGFVLYGAQIVGVHFLVQLITYLQHWGLGDDTLAEAVDKEYAWEDTCQLQAWLVMGLSLHQSHHLRPGLAYYRVAPMQTSPRPPMSYAWLMLVALVPGLWRIAMLPALDYWKRSPGRPLSPGRRLHCFGLYSKA